MLYLETLVRAYWWLCKTEIWSCLGILEYITLGIVVITYLLTYLLTNTHTHTHTHTHTTKLCAVVQYNGANISCARYRTERKGLCQHHRKQRVKHFSRHFLSYVGLSICIFNIFIYDPMAWSLSPLIFLHEWISDALSLSSDVMFTCLRFKSHNPVDTARCRYLRRGVLRRS